MKLVVVTLVASLGIVAVELDVHAQSGAKGSTEPDAMARTLASSLDLDETATQALADALKKNPEAVAEIDQAKTDIKNAANDAATGPARPQLLAVRGGSLGFPSPSNNEGILAGVVAKISAGADLSSTSSADAFAKVGGVDIGRVRAEVLGETFEADIPVITLNGMPAAPSMTKVGFSAVGIRARVNFHATLWASRPLSETCIQKLALRRVLAAAARPPESLAPARTALANDTECKEEGDAVTTSAVWSAMAGMRLVRRGSGSDALTDLGGVEWEFGVRRDSDTKIDNRLSWSAMAGFSGLHLNEADSVTAGVTTRYLRMNDVRATFAAEVRRPATKDATTSALGIYGVVSQDYWTNKFHVGGADKVRDYQLEGGMYVSGVMNGFSGLIMLSVIRPYAHGAQNVYAVSVIPFGGAVPTKGDKQ